MKLQTPEIIALGLAAVAVFLIVSNGKECPFCNAFKAKVKEVLNPGGGAFANGWRYFDDGTSIDPEGRYYKGGQLIWTPPA